ncbi:hypothetical protein [Anaerobacillus arseniciselenatis]|uniref:hypothetical protein n=1 Tax=Anaerobacillus arseniciselenatis TaxID=85682 RepID=UPI001470E798|nr:hypothetical protein [Anaerobacillus arseniciselenatis]
MSVIFEEESTYEGSAVEAINRMFLEDGVIELEYEIKSEEILPYEDFIDEDLED